MKRIVIACDGTWNRLDAAYPTNVAKLVQAVLPLAPDGVPQVACHLDGVGTGRGTGWLARAADRVLGGALGQGLLATLEAAYRFLVFAYAPGDTIFLFGFSRGAYTARSLAGLIRTCGILERRHAAAIPEAIALYRNRAAAGGADAPAAWRFRARAATHVTTSAAEELWRLAGDLPAGRRLSIAYLGVWDTVGALGLPGHLALAGWLNRGLAFHDTRLTRLVAAARHAVAIDERRRTFPPTLWQNLDALNAATSGAPYAQRWFPGDHGSVGGGGSVTALSDDALGWIGDGAAAQGLGLDPAAVAAWERGRDCLGPLRARPKPSALGRLLALDAADRTGPGRLAELAEAAVRRWHGDPSYRPSTLARVAPALATGAAPARPRPFRAAGAAAGRPARSALH